MRGSLPTTGGPEEDGGSGVRLESRQAGFCPPSLPALQVPPHPAAGPGGDGRASIQILRADITDRWKISR